MSIYQHKSGWWIVPAVKLQRDLVFPRRERKQWFGKPIIIEEKRYPAGGYIVGSADAYWFYMSAEEFEYWYVWLG